MKNKAFFVVLIASIVAILGAVSYFGIARAGDDGFGYGETYPCQVCTKSETRDLNQYVIKDTIPGERIPYDYWSPIPGERGNYFHLCGYVPGAAVAEVVYLIPIYYNASGRNYKSHLDGWAKPGDGGHYQDVTFPLSFGHGWKVKAKWYDEPITVTKPCDGQTGELDKNCQYTYDQQGNCSITCEERLQGWVFGDDANLVTATGEQAAEICAPHPPNGDTGWIQTTDEIVIPPCTEIKVVQEEDGSVTFGCTMHYYNASVEVSFCAAVERKPFPRAITGQPVFFKIDPAQEFSASSSPINFCTPDVQNYVLTLTARPDTSTEPMWRFNDRPSVLEQTATGWTVQHTFETSSWGLDLMGPSLTGEWLPAYKVEALVPYTIYIQRTWTDFHGGGHAIETEVDLRDYGYPTKDLWVPAYDATTPPPGVPDMHWPQCIVPVPVIESQGVITGP